MATKGKRTYQDDDEIDKAIKEFRGEPTPPEPIVDGVFPPPSGGFPIDQIIEVPEPPEPEALPKEIGTMTCSCCESKWTYVGSRLQPTCGCAIHPICKTCGHCSTHCEGHV